MMRIRDEVEHEIWWQQKEGTASFWMDNWTKQGALYFTEPQGLNEEVEVKEMILNEQWNTSRLRQLIFEDMVKCIMDNINPRMKGEDKAWWMGNTQGEFTVKSAFQLMRRKKEEYEWRNNIWIKGLPFKISFFLWRVWRKRIPTDDVIKKMKVYMASKCYCCNVGEEETIQHIFLTALIAQKLWNHFASCAGINIEGLHLQQLITTWWDWPAKPKLQQILKAMPAIIMWELWKRRNARRHGREVTYEKMKSQCHKTAQMLLRVKYPWIKGGDQVWKDMIAILNTYKPKIHFRVVHWDPPDADWVTCNTDGACKGNSGHSSYGFSIRDTKGDLIYAEAQCIGEATNMEAELMGYGWP
ncbi:uncharacterized protein LOC125852859 [Solanum stenotomum]|uniref:uncharacterized protein LOC125852859 n=1 Tax=Solanum stenotomum TaxID=172797 RepID=UPI0020D1BEDA|nr:uncharacterized protein LOC125852859 [Solanum stenotomum]